MGSCDYCGTGIATICTIKSADGKTFKVGCDCVRKVDAPTTKLVKAVNKAKRDMQKAREAKRIAAAFDLLDSRDDVAAAMAEVKAERGGGSVLEYVQFCRTGAGHSGKLRVARIIESYAAKVDA